MLDNDDAEIIAECARQMGLSLQDLTGLLNAIARMLEDSLFIKQLLAINAKVINIAKDN